MPLTAVRAAVLATVHAVVPARIWSSIQAVFPATGAACLLLMISVLTLFVTPVLGAEQTDATATEEPPDAYEVKFEGIDDDDLLDVMERISRLIALQKSPTASQAGLLRRVEEDRERFEAVLRSNAYYDNQMTTDIDQEAEPPVITFQIELGPQYKLQAYTINYDPPDPLLPQNLADIGLTIGMAARSAPITNAQNRLIRLLKEQGYPLAVVSNQEAIVDHADDSMRVTLDVDTGPFATFGPISFEGSDNVEDAYLHRLADWPVDAPYDQRVIDDLRRRLLETNLFDSVRIAPVNEVNSLGQVETAIVLVERKARSIGVGGSYSSDDEGFGAEASWEHRNLFGEQESLKFTIDLNQIRQEGSAEFRKPNYIELDQTLVLESGLVRQTTDAFDEVSVNSFGGLEREIDDLWTLGAGGSLEWSRIKDNEGRRTFLIGGVPVFAQLDESNDLLNPTKGYRIDIFSTPYLGTTSSESNIISFLKNEVQLRGYLSPFETDFITFAGRSRVGSIVGEATATLPANKRFYAGGGGSIRGYEYQSVGPLDANNDPLGGRSLFEISAEARFRISESFGVVPFIDGGNVYDQELPNLSEEIRWAAGIGARYFSAIGPIRFDLAFPINRRDIDNVFQFYISIGQAF